MATSMSGTRSRSPSEARTLANVAALPMQQAEHRQLQEQQHADKDAERQDNLPHEKTTATPGKDPNQVDWEPNDKENPKNFPLPYKIFITVQLGILAFCASLGSSIISPANSTIAKVLGVSQEVTVLNVALYVLGFAFGPLLWAPISEVWGRRMSLLPAVFVLGLFSIGTATSKTPAAVFLTRFFGGVFGSGPVSNVSAAMGDIYHPAARGTAITFYACMVVGGPTLGPTIGSAILVNPHLGWRWTEYIEAVVVFTAFTLAFFFLPELYAPVLLKRRARRLRKETGNTNLFHPHEKIKLDFKSIVTKQLSRPLLMLFTETMVTCIALYASFVYSLLYLTLEVFPIVFEDERQYSPVVASLPFLGLFIGVLFAMGLNLGNQPRYKRIARAAHGKPVPEARLPPVVIGSWLFVIGLFWFGWTAAPKYSWGLPCVATIFIGAGFNTIFQQCINFLVDTYGLYAASAVSANTFLRSILAAGLPMAARPMFKRLGVGPAMSLLGGLACLALPIPWVFMKYGKRLRKRSRFAPYEDDEEQETNDDKKEEKA